MPSGPGADKEGNIKSALAISALVRGGADMCTLNLGGARRQPLGGRSGQTGPHSFVPGSQPLEGRGNGGACILRRTSWPSTGFGEWLLRGKRTSASFSRP